MKKIFTLFVAAMLTNAAIAQDKAEKKAEKKKVEKKVQKTHKKATPEQIRKFNELEKKKTQ
jgi:hypothetical protein